MPEPGIVRRVVTEDIEPENRSRLEMGAGCQNLDLNRFDLARRQRLSLPVCVPGPTGAAARRIRLPVRGAEPSFGDAVLVETVVAVEADLVAVPIELSKQHKQIEILTL